ncbi:MAG: hypothetical protein AB7P07_11485 [Hyphomonadaceae bacterium]
MRNALPIAALLAACSPAPPRPDQAPLPAAQLEAAPGQINLAELEGRIVALGRSPEWRLDADAQLGIVLVMPEQGLTFSADFAAPQRHDAGAHIASDPVSLTLETGPCQIDGVPYPLRARAEVEQGEPLAGCGFVRWDWRLIELLPAIDACIVQSPTTRRVTYAALGDGAQVFVRLHGEDAPPADCTAPLAPNGAAARVTARDALRRIGGEGDAIFVRAPGENPGGECYEAPEVRAADGALLGWMDDPLGC